MSVRRQDHPTLHFEVASIYEKDIVARWKGPVDGIVSLEVVEYLFDPKAFFAQSHKLLEGVAGSLSSARPIMDI